MCDKKMQMKNLIEYANLASVKCVRNKGGKGFRCELSRSLKDRPEEVELVATMSVRRLYISNMDEIYSVPDEISFEMTEYGSSISCSYVPMSEPGGVMNCGGIKAR